MSLRKINLINLFNFYLQILKLPSGYRINTIKKLLIFLILVISSILLTTNLVSYVEMPSVVMIILVLSILYLLFLIFNLIIRFFNVFIRFSININIMVKTLTIKHIIFYYIYNVFISIISILIIFRIYNKVGLYNIELADYIRLLSFYISGLRSTQYWIIIFRFIRYLT